MGGKCGGSHAAQNGCATIGGGLSSMPRCNCVVAHYNPLSMLVGRSWQEVQRLPATCNTDNVASARPVLSSVRDCEAFRVRGAAPGGGTFASCQHGRSPLGRGVQQRLRGWPPNCSVDRPRSHCDQPHRTHHHAWLHRWNSAHRTPLLSPTPISPSTTSNLMENLMDPAAYAALVATPWLPTGSS